MKTKCTRILFVILLTLLCLTLIVGISNYFLGQEILSFDILNIFVNRIPDEYALDEESLPVNWTLKNTVVVPQENLQAFSEKLKGGITAISNYFIDCKGKDLQVNILTTSSKKEARDIFNYISTLKSKDYLQIERNFVVEYISSDLGVIKRAKRELIYLEVGSMSVLSTTEGRYLNENYTSIRINDSQSKGFELLEDSIQGKELFVTAEVHGLAINQKLELKFLKYFKENVGVSYYLQETAFSTSMLLNDYLRTGDEKILNKIMQPLKGTFAWTKEKYQHWKNLYNYNQTLPEEERLIVLGFDIEHQLENAFWYLNTILPEKEAPTAIESYIQKIKTIYQENKYQEVGIEDFSRKLKDNINVNKKVYQDYLGSEFLGFVLVNENIINRFIAYGIDDDKWNSTRDEMMFHNFLQIYLKYNDGKYYGQWGLNHVFQQKQGGVNWFATYLNHHQDSPLIGKVLSIVYLYQDCETIRNVDYKTRALSTYNSKNKIMDKISRGNITLFKLDGNNSPYNNKLNWMLSVKKPEEGVTTSYFQYVLLLKNFKPSTPIK